MSQVRKLARSLFLCAVSAVLLLGAPSRSSSQVPSPGSCPRPAMPSLVIDKSGVVVGELFDTEFSRQKCFYIVRRPDGGYWVVNSSQFLLRPKEQPSQPFVSPPTSLPGADQEGMSNWLREAIDRGEVVIGMAPEHVEQAWGETDCAFKDKFEGHFAEAWGYGRDPRTGQLVGIMDCKRAVLVVYFVDGKVAGWASRE